MVFRRQLKVSMSLLHISRWPVNTSVQYQPHNQLWPVACVWSAVQSCLGQLPSAMICLPTWTIEEQHNLAVLSSCPADMCGYRNSASCQQQDRSSSRVDQVLVETLQNGTGGRDVARVEGAHHLLDELGEGSAVHDLQGDSAQSALMHSCNDMTVGEMPCQHASWPEKSAQEHYCQVTTELLAQGKTSLELLGLGLLGCSVAATLRICSAVTHHLVLMAWPSTLRSLTFVAQHSHLPIDPLGFCHALHQQLELVALMHIGSLQLGVVQLTQAGALQVGLPQAKGCAVSRNDLQRLPDLVHLQCNSADSADQSVASA